MTIAAFGETRLVKRTQMMHVHVATPLARQTIGLRREGRTVTVWFYELRLGSFVYGLDKSEQPLPLIEAEERND